MNKALYFTNVSDTDFSYAWDSQIMKFKSGETILIEGGKANHFARHLAIRELNKDNKPADKASVKTLSATYLSEDAVVANSEAELETKILNANDKPKKKASKKTAKKVAEKKAPKEEKKEEKEFEDLD